MKTIKTILFTIIALLSVQLANAQCNGSLSVSGTSPTFTFTSTNVTGGWMIYSWDFGDGNYAYTSQTATHTYNSNGTYAVICYFTDSLAGCVDIDTLILTVTGVTPTCSAAYTTTGNDPTFTFTPTTAPIAPIGYYSFVWNFGDGVTANTGNMASVAHTYTANGTYTVTCILYDSIYCIDTVTSTLIVTGVVNQTCDASFTYADSNGLVAFSPSYPTANSSYYWNFGDGTSSTVQNPVHQYNPTGTGTYTACLTISSASCTDSTCTTFTISTNPVPCDASFTYTGSGAYYYFNATYPTAGATYSWVVSNGATYGTQNPQIGFTTSGLYTVCLTITDATGTCTATSCDSLFVTVPLNYDIYGWVQMGNIPADSGVVYLIEYDSTLGTLSAVDTAMIDSMGTYVFYNTNPGSYLVKAALSTASINYSSYLPTYYAIPSAGNMGGELLWSNADFASSPNSNIYYGIDLVAGTNPGGAGFVGGLVSQGANKVGDPISDIAIIVTDMSGSPVAYAYSDVNGSFTIGNLPYGDYVLYPEVYGKTTNSMNFTLSSSNDDIDNFKVDVNSTTVDVSIATGIQTVSEFTEVTLFPNPVQNELNIDFGKSLTNTVTIEMYDVAGRKISSQNISGSSTLRINTTDLLEGVYLIKLSSNEGEQVLRFVK